MKACVTEKIEVITYMKCYNTGIDVYKGIFTILIVETLC